MREVVAPPDWRAIDFVSDLHLSPALPRTTAAFQRYLEGTPAEAVFILGDLFEVWIGDDARELPYEAGVVAMLGAAARERRLYFMAGNRDFLVGPALLLAAGMTGLEDPSVLDFAGTRVVLTHGDAWCLDDTEYQAFRTLVRSAAWQQEFLAKPLSERAQIAAGIRAESRQRQRFDGRTDADVDPATAAAALREAHAGVLVHGHTHRPGSDGMRHVLSDWDLDDAAHPRAEVLRLTRAGFQRLSLSA